MQADSSKLLPQMYTLFKVELYFKQSAIAHKPSPDILFDLIDNLIHKWSVELINETNLYFTFLRRCLRTSKRLLRLLHHHFRVYYNLNQAF
jgi:hypothetical protein